MQTAPALPVARCRLLSTGKQSLADPFSVGVALNGSKGRRVGCFRLGEGLEIEILDMEDEEEDGDGSAGVENESMEAEM